MIVPSTPLLFQRLGAFVGEFHPRALPTMLRANYARELYSGMLMPLMLGALEGGTMAIVVKKMFTGVDGIDPMTVDYAVAAVSAAPNVANLSSFVWAALAHGRPKVAFISGLQLLTCACVLLAAFVPITTLGLLLLTALVMISRIAWTGVITVRAAVWRNNYPRASRAIIAGRMATVQSLVLALAGLLIGCALDLRADSFRVLFPALALTGVIANSIWRRVRLRGQRGLQLAEIESGSGATRIDPRHLLHLLRDDRLYARFMWWMSVFGLGNLMVGPPQVLVLNNQFHTSYLEGILITTAIPLVVMPLAIPIWSRLLSQQHVVAFRAVHGWTFVLGTGAIWLAALLDSMTLMYASSVLLGIGFAGGSLAWNLGHHDFAPAHRDSEYMAIHVTLNGIRGAIAPFLAVLIFDPLTRIDAGSWFFFLCMLVNLAGVLGFRAMRRHLPPRIAAEI
jgi:MFS family permease